MTMTPYAFWCSRCKVSHAGECAVIEEHKREWPAIGSKWHVLTLQPDGSWHHGDTRVYEITRWVLTEMLVYISCYGNAFETGYPVEMWTSPNGGKSKYYQLKMVPVA